MEENIIETKKPAKKAPAKKAPVKTKIDPKTGTLKVVESKPKKDTKKKDTKDTKKKDTKKSTTKKTTTKKTTTKKTQDKSTTKKTTTPKTKKVDNKVTDVVEVVENIETPVEEVVESVVAKDVEVVESITPTVPEVKVSNEPKRRGRKPSENPLPKVSSRDLTIEPPKRQPKEEPKKKAKDEPKEPEVIVRPTPKKTKVLTKEEKVIYKKLEEAFNYVANLTMVVEEKTMDTKVVSDLTVGELHVIEMVDKNNNKPMTLIANKLKVTVGSLTIAINRLVQKGYLLRTRHEMDHRIILVSTTQKGKKVLKAHDKFHEDILGLVLEGVTLQQAMKVMTQFALVLENYYDPKTIVTSAEKKGTKK